MPRLPVGTKAADQGELVAQMYLAIAYRRGLGVPRSYVQAGRWYARAVGTIAIRHERRRSWTPVISIFLFVASLVLPQKRWRGAQRVSCGLMSLGFAAALFYFASGFRPAWSIRLVAIALCAIMSVAYALAALSAEVRGAEH